MKREQLIAICAIVIIVGLVGSFIILAPTGSVEEEMDVVVINITSSGNDNVTLALPQYDWWDQNPEGYKFYELPFKFISYRDSRSVNNTRQLWFRERLWNETSSLWFYQPLQGPFFFHPGDFENMTIRLNRNIVDITIYLDYWDY